MESINYSSVIENVSKFPYGTLMGVATLPKLLNIGKASANLPVRYEYYQNAVQNGNWIPYLGLTEEYQYTFKDGVLAEQRINTIIPR